MHRTGNILLWIWWACSQCDENRPSHLWKFSSPMNLNWKCNGSAFILPDICGAFDNCQRDGLGLSNRFHFWKHWHEKGSFSFIKSHLTIQNIKKMNQIFGSNKNFDRNFVRFSPNFAYYEKCDALFNCGSIRSSLSALHQIAHGWSAFLEKSEWFIACNMCLYA